MRIKHFLTIAMCLIPIPAMADKVQDEVSESIKRETDNYNRQLDQIKIEEQLREQQRQIELQRAEMDRRLREDHN